MQTRDKRREKITGWIVGVECAKANLPGSDVFPDDSDSQAGFGERSVACSVEAIERMVDIQEKQAKCMGA